MATRLPFFAATPAVSLRRLHRFPATSSFSGTRPRAMPSFPPPPARINTTASASSRPLNVLGTELRCCCLSPRTGFYRDGHCQTGPDDAGVHTVCVIVTDEFLRFSARRGNDLSTPNPLYGFPGLREGDRWCLCASRWKEAADAGVAPRVVLEATHAKTLEFATLADLQAHSTPFVEPAASE